MDSKSLIEDIDEKFCQCCLCLEQYKEPKLLPCLHRFCKNCLENLIQVNPEVLPCPICRDECTVPEGRIDGFKTDFHMTNIIEFIELRKSLEGGNTRECIGCSKKENIFAYCFKCNSFLCAMCFEYHKSNNMLKDHRSHILSLRDVESGNITLEKLESLKEAPRCKTHPENVSQLCCSTCDNLPVCITCSYGQRHKDHKIYDVIDLANKEKDTLSENLALLNKSKDSLYDTIENLKRKPSTIVTDINEQMQHLQRKYKDDKTAIELKRNEKLTQKESAEIEAKSHYEKVTKNLRERMAFEIKQAKERYHESFVKEKQEYENRLIRIRENQEKEEAALDKEDQVIEIHMKKSKEALKEEEKVKLNSNSKELQYFDNAFKRIENLNTTASCILSANNIWTFVQCIPDVCLAIKSLFKVMKIECKDLSQPTALQTAVSNHPEDIVEKKTSQITLKHDTLIVSIDQIRAEGWKVFDFVSIDNYVAIFGETKTLKRKFISLHSMSGNLIRKAKMTFCDKPLCVGFKKSIIAMAHKPKVVALFDIFNDELRKKNVKENIEDTLADIYTSINCIATDYTNSRILVGCYYSSFLLMYDDKLNYSGGIKLPASKIQYPGDIAVSKGDIIVCGGNNSIVFVVNIKGQIIHEIDRKNLDQPLQIPIEVQTDKNGHVYVSWHDASSDDYSIVMYDENKTNPILSRPLNGNAWCLSTGTETQKLMMIDGNSGILLLQEVYGTNQLER